jgi:type IV pilus assembly protein PilB
MVEEFGEESGIDRPIVTVELVTIEMVEEFSEASRMDYIDPRLIATSPELAALLPEPVAREHIVVPQGRQGRVLRILISDPNDFFAMERLRFVVCSGTEVQFAVSSRGAIQEAIERIYGDRSPHSG